MILHIFLVLGVGRTSRSRKPCFGQIAVAGKPVFSIGPYAEIVKKEYKEETEKLLTIDKHYGQGDLASRIADWISKIKVGEVRSVKTISPKLALDSLGIKFSN